jgi:replication-associated recombination protein RarA
MKEETFYQPRGNGYEARILERLERWTELRRKS